MKGEDYSKKSDLELLGMFAHFFQEYDEWRDDEIGIRCDHPNEDVWDKETMECNEVTVAQIQAYRKDIKGIIDEINRRIGNG